MGLEAVEAAGEGLLPHRLDEVAPQGELPQPRQSPEGRGHVLDGVADLVAVEGEGLEGGYLSSKDIYK